MENIYKKKSLKIYPPIREEPECIVGGGGAIIRKILCCKHSGEGFEMGTIEKDPVMTILNNIMLDENGMLSTDSMVDVTNWKVVYLVTDDRKLAMKTGCLLNGLHSIAVANFGKDGEAYDSDWGELEENERAPVKTVAFHLDKIKSDKDEDRYAKLASLIMVSMRDMEYSYFDGIDNSMEFEEQLDVIRSCPGNMRVVCIPRKLKNTPALQTLVQLYPENNRLMEIGKNDFEYYFRVCKNLLDGEGAFFSDDKELRHALIRMKRHLGSEFCEEWIGYFLDLGRVGNGFDQAKMFSGYGGAELISPGDRLERMTGLGNFKEVMREYASLVKEESINSNLKMHKNMIFAGNPGSGKSTAARLTAEIFADIGVTDPVFYSPSRSDLVGKYVGHTAHNVKEAFDGTRGGVLFVDEAGFFLNTGSGGFVGEAVKEFVRFMEEYPDVTVIFAMYESEVESFMELDDGLRSRISRVVKFEDYSTTELIGITKYMLEEKGYSLEGGRKALADYFADELKKDNFGNARAARKLVESIILSKSLSRIDSDSNPPEMSITEDMVKQGIKRIKNETIGRKKAINIGFVAGGDDLHKYVNAIL